MTLKYLNSKDIKVWSNQPITTTWPAVVLCPGHSRRGPGATRGQIEEHAYWVDVARAAIPRATQAGIALYVTDRIAPGFWGFKQECELVDDIGGDKASDTLHIQLHVNSGGGKGTMTAYTSGSHRGEYLAHCIQQEITCALGTDNYYSPHGLVSLPCLDFPRMGGVKVGTRAMTARSKGPSILLEACFIDNDTEFEKLKNEKNKKNKIPNAIIQAILSYFSAR